MPFPVHYPAGTPPTLPRCRAWRIGIDWPLQQGDALPGGTVALNSALVAMAKESVANALEAAPIGLTLLALLDKLSGWNETTTALLAKLNEMRTMASARDDNWPKSTMMLVGALKRLAPVLREAGWVVSFGARDGSTSSHGRRLTICPTKGSVHSKPKALKRGRF